MRYLLLLSLLAISACAPLDAHDKQMSEVCRIEADLRPGLVASQTPPGEVRAAIVAMHVHAEQTSNSDVRTAVAMLFDLTKGDYWRPADVTSLLDDVQHACSK